MKYIVISQMFISNTLKYEDFFMTNSRNYITEYLNYAYALKKGLILINE